MNNEYVWMNTEELSCLSRVKLTIIITEANIV